MTNNIENKLFLEGRYTDSEWALIQELAQRLGVADQVQRENPRANRDVLLAGLGYSPAWPVENGLLGLAAVWFTNCLRCGATLPLRAAQQGHLAPLDQHSHWHAATEGVLPNGRKVQA